MKLYDYLKLIYIDLKGRKFSSFLTLFAISLGIMSIFIIIVISQSFENSVQKQFESLGTNKVIITPKGSNIMSGQLLKGTLSDSEIDLIKSKPYIKNAYPMYFKITSYKYEKEYLPANPIYGIKFDNNFYNDFNYRIDKGRLPGKNEKYGLIVGSEFAKNKFDKEVVIGSNIFVKDIKFKVVAILKPFGNPEDDSNVYMSEYAFKKLFGEKKDIDFIIAIVKKDYEVKLASENLKRVLERKLGDDSINIMTFDQFLESMQNVLNIIKFSLGGIGLVSLLIGAVGIINTMFVIVSERTKEIGIMKSIGAKNRDILYLFMFQSGIFGLLGGIFGVLIGSIISIFFGRWAISYGYSFLELIISPSVVIFFLLFSFCIGLIAGFIPSYKASKIVIVETFRK